MLEVDVSCLVDGSVAASDLSGSVAERGSNAGPETWRNSLDATRRRKLPGFNDAEARKFFAGFGAWSDDEIAAWSVHEVRALVLQYAAGDLRELQSLAPGDGLGGIDWQVADALADRGQVGGRLFDAKDGKRLFIQLD